MKRQTLILIFLIIPIMLVADSLSDGNKQFIDKNYAEALIKYNEAEKQNPESALAKLNQGNVFYKINDLVKATIQYEDGIEKIKDDDKLESKALYNLGNSFFKRANSALQNQEMGKAQESYQRAISNYKESLKINPDNEDAKHNLYLVKKLLDKAREQQQDNQDKENKQNNEQKDNQDRDNQDKKNNKDNQNEDNKENDEKNQEKDEQNNQNDDEKNKQDKEKQQDKPADIDKEQMEQYLNYLREKEKQERADMLLRQNQRKGESNEKDW